jgi:hypothetical protein
MAFGMRTAGSSRGVALEFRKRVPSQRGEAAMRSWRNELDAAGISLDYLQVRKSVRVLHHFVRKCRSRARIAGNG